MAGAQGSETVLDELKPAIRTIVENYNKYSSKKIPLLRKEGINATNFKRMLQTELSQMLTNTKNKEAVDKLMRKLDEDGAKNKEAADKLKCNQNANGDKNGENEEAAENLNAKGDGVIDFEEYWDFIGSIAGPIAKYKLETKTAIEPKGNNPLQ